MILLQKSALQLLYLLMHFFSDWHLLGKRFHNDLSQPISNSINKHPFDFSERTFSFKNFFSDVSSSLIISVCSSIHCSYFQSIRNIHKKNEKIKGVFQKTRHDDVLNRQFMHPFQENDRNVDQHERLRFYHLSKNAFNP
jgi:hypothetical protein